MTTTVCITPLTLGSPENGGHLWVYLNWALSLRALGCRVIWLEDIDGLTSWPAERTEREIVILDERLAAHGMPDALALTNFNRSPLAANLTDGRLDLEAAIEISDVVLDFAYDTPAEALSRFRRSALVDLDPGLLQLWMSDGDLQVAEHDVYFTIGETVGRSGARFPDCGVSWHYTPPPVFLPAWPTVAAAKDAPYTTVTNWWDGWIEFNGRSIENTKRSAFLPYVELPGRSAARLELALGMLRGDDYTAQNDQPLFEQGGWSMRDAWEVCATPESYREYIGASRGEFSCARPSCRLLSNAWVSDRTLCYLACGKPAVVEHTGPSHLLPEAAGLFRFRDIEEAASAIATIEADYETHSRLARKLAEERFDGERLVGHVLERALP
jgi:hypothetical protein